MKLELGDVIAQIGGAGGGVDAVPHRYVHDFGHTPIPVDGAIMHEVPDVPEGATLVVTLEWTGPETGGPAVALGHAPAVVLGHAFDTVTAIGFAGDAFGIGVLPLTVVATASGKERKERGMFFFAATAEGYTATKLEAIIIPAIK